MISSHLACFSEYGQRTILETGPVVEERSGGASLDHISQGGSIVESSSRPHPPIFLRIKRPTVARVNISPPRCRRYAREFVVEAFII
jgi:hypothetical protein